MDVKQGLKEAGLEGRQADVYVACLRLGAATAGQISTESGVSRGIIYQYLAALERKGMLQTFAVDGVKRYAPRPPEQLLSVMKQREESLLMMLPELSRLHRTASEPLAVSMIRGEDGIKALFNDMLKLPKGGEVLATVPYLSHMAKHGAFIVAWSRKRERLGIRMRIMYCNTPAALPHAIERNKLRLTEARLFDVINKTNIMVYGDKAALFLWDANPPFGVLVENADIAGMFREYFNIAWKTGKKL